MTYVEFRIVLWAIVGTLTVVTLLLFGVFLWISRRKSDQSLSEKLRGSLLLIIGGVIQVILLPWTIFKGVFFAIDEGMGERLNFSLTRTIFALGSFILLYRLATGGLLLEDVRVGPTVKGGSIHSTQKDSKRKGVPQEKTKTRPYFYIKKLQYTPIQFYDLMLFLILAGLYYYRRDFRSGGEKGMLDKVLDTIGHAYAVKLSGVTPTTTTTTSSTEQTTTQTSGRERKPSEIMSEAEDPFLRGRVT